MEETSEKIEQGLAPLLIEVAKQLSQSMRMRSFYPKGHGAIAASVGALKKTLSALFAGREEIAISSAGGELHFDGHVFGEDNKPCRRLALHFKVRDISGVTFRSGITEAELEDAVEMLSADPELYATEASPLSSAASRCEHICFKQIRYGNVLRHVSEEAAESICADDMRDVWRMLLTDDSSGPEPAIPQQAKAIIAKSAGSTAAFEGMTRELVRASERYGGDRSAAVAKGIAMTCDALAEVPRERRDDSTTFLAEMLEQMDPEIALKLIEKVETWDHATKQDVISEVAQKFTPSAKLTLLAAVVGSQKGNPGRLFSMFSRVVGAEKRRAELLKAIEEEALSSVRQEDEKFDAVLSAVQELVISEAEARFVGSGYGSMLKELSEDSASPSVVSESDAELVCELRRSLSPDGLPAAMARFLTDMAGLQESPDGLRKTLSDLRPTCDSLCEKKEFEPVVDAACEIAGYLAAPEAGAGHREDALRECLRFLLEGSAGRLILERLTRSGDDSNGRLRAALEASGGLVCREVCDLVASSDLALQNEHVRNYLKAHADRAVELCADMLRESPAPYARRTLKALAVMNTPTAIMAIRSALTHHDHSVQAEAVKSLAGLRSEDANAILHGILTGADRNLARIAAISLGESASPEAAQILVESLRCLDFLGRKIPEVQNVAAVLGRMGHQAAVPHLEMVLKKRLWTSPAAKKKLREAVAHSLRSIGGDQASAALQRGASCRNKGVREVCEAALRRPERRRGPKGPRTEADGLREPDASKVDEP